MRDLDMAAPKVIMLCYGENEAFGNDAERAEFIAGYHKLLDDVKRHNAKVILVIPRQREDAGKEFPNPKYYNQNLSKLAEAIRKLAKDHNCSVVDLEKFAPNERFTKEGVAWNDEGYQKSAREIMKQLGFANPRADKIVASKPQQIETIQNETYLFLFRKHEQGNNAVEVDRMEQFVADGESQITKWLADNQLAPAQ
jgi:3-dehydroquinate dehydratase